MQKLVASLNLRAAVFIVISTVLGSGVFKKVALMSATLQSPLLVLLCWVLAGVISLAGALCSAELAGMYANSGGEYFYFKKVYNRFFAFIYGWANFVVLKTAAIAALSYIFAQSLNNIIALPQPSWNNSDNGQYIIDNFSVKLLASLVIIALTFINSRGVKYAGKLNKVMTLIMLFAAAAIIIGGFSSPAGEVSNLVTKSSHSNADFTGWPVLQAIIIASLGAFWGYEGWNGIGFLGEEIKNPKRNLPLALSIGMLLIMLIYVLLNLVYLYVLPIDALIEINNHPNQIAALEVMKIVWGNNGKILVASLILITTFNSTNSTILTSARVFFAMARDKNFFKQAAVIHPKHNTPTVALFMQAGWAVLLIWSGTFDQLTNMLIFASFIYYGATALGVMVMRKRAPGVVRTYSVIGYPFTPLFFCLFCVLLLGVTIWHQPLEALAGLGLIASGIPFYFYWNKKVNCDENLIFDQKSMIE